MSKHTPGPWKVENDHYITAGIDYVADVGDATTRDKEIAANARLIAAAPDLLEACKEAIEMSHWLRSLRNTVMEWAPEFFERNDDPEAVEFLMNECDHIRARLQAAIAAAEE